MLSLRDKKVSNFTFIKLFALTVVLSVCVHSFVFAEPIISNPRFKQLSTENGLSQDSVNDMLVDSDGFLWVATETGLNRYDGHHNKQYIGLQNEFADDGIYSLFEDKNGDIWVSTYSSGVYRISRATGKSERLLAITYQSEPSWYQYASHYIEGPDDTLFIAFDHIVVQYNLTTNTWETVFDLLAPELAISDDEVIRYLTLHDDVLFVAVSTGLYTFHIPSFTIKKVEYIKNSDANKDKMNAKLILIDDKHQFWLGTVDGLYRFDLAELLGFARGQDNMPRSVRALSSLNIWSMLSIKGSQYYLATNDGLYIIDLNTLQLQHLFRPSNSNLLMTDDNLTKMAQTPNGQLWLSTKTSGMLLWNPRSVLFKNIFSDKSSPNQLSDNMVHDFHVQNDTNLWVGTNNGLNLYNLETGDFEHFLVSPDKKAVASFGSIFIIREGEDNWVWLVTYEAILKFDLVTKRVIPLSMDAKANALLSSDMAYDILRLSKNKYIVAGEEQFYLLDGTKNTLTKDEVLSATLDTSQFYTFIPDYDGEEHTVLISMTGGLWRYHVATSQLEKIHEARSFQSEYVIQPTEAILDDYNTLWISYPGHGLYGLDATTYKQKHFFDTSNLLPTNIVFSLEKDDNGYIWMGSHKGLLQFNPKTLAIKQYTTKEGLINNEFKWGAKKPLNNGDLVFGSQKGFTLFNPDQFVQKNEVTSNVLITDVSLISNQLELGAGNKNGKTVILQHNDIGLTINYSDMQYDQTNVSHYKYALLGGVDVTYPPTNSTEVTFPQLEPGQYTFEVSRFNVANNTTGPVSSLRIKVHYPPFASPFAYLVYSLLVILFLVIFFWRRKLNSDKLKAAHLAVLKNKNRLSMALTASNTKVWQWREDTNNISQERIATELGYDALDGSIDFDSHCALIHEHDLKAFKSQWQLVLEGQRKNLDLTYRLQAKDGHYEWYRDVGAIVDSPEASDTIKLAGTYSNVTESINTQTKAQLYGEAFEHTRDWVVIFDGAFKPIVANQSFKDALCLCPNEDIAVQLSQIFSDQKSALFESLRNMRRLAPNEHWSGETEIQSLKGDKFVVNIGITAVTNAQDHNEISRYLVILSDITQQKDAQGALVQLANYDSLTGLPNRSLLLDRVQHAFDQAIRDNTSIGLFFIDLDRFKQVNDSLGHDAGDTLLRVVGERLENLMRQSDTVARLGGDEFVVMIEKVSKEKDLSHIANEMIKELSKSVMLSNQVVSVSASVGISVFPEDASTPAELLKNADIAMYHAKELGSNNFQYFTEYMNERAQNKLRLENAVKQAHANKQFIGYYQPIVHCKTGRISGFEVLMRWPTENGMTPPDVFIPVAEDIGLVEDMTISLIEQAIPTLTSPEWRQSGYYLSINLSATHISKCAKIDEIVVLLAAHDIPNSAIRFEITESALMSDYESAMRAMAKMKECGFVIALDDFGTGYSSLKYLKDFPIDILKIDKSFVQDIGFNGGNEAIILATLRMADSLNIQCVAEGIETQEQAAFFKQYGCEYLQGYLYAKPLPEADMLTLLHDNVLSTSE
jgi:diguanylate cyclase (GGDEF)-like protein